MERGSISITLRTMKLLLRIGSVLSLFGIIAYFCAFKVSDVDFWWHVKAGEIMLQTKSLISIEPFAYTRIGAPYLAQHEWLAQIVLALIFNIGGSTSVILFRMFIAVIVAGVLLTIDRKNVAVNALLVALTIPLALPAFRERPQLFTLLLFAVFLVMLMRCMDRQWVLPGMTRDYWMLFFLLFLQILWVNTHGAAALLGLALFGFFVIQEAFEGFLNEGISTLRRSGFFWALGLAGLPPPLLLSPSGFGNLIYLFHLLSDQTAELIREWQPRTFLWYIRDFWWIWSAVIASVLLTRRKIVFSVLTLLFMGYLSREAIRHEVLFVITAIALILYQLKWNERWQAFLHYFYGTWKTLSLFFSVVILIFATWHAHVRAQEFSHNNHLRGFGVFEPLKRAYEFFEKNGVTGNTFNTYGDGGYLLYRGYPDRKVFIDGRNVDYGFAFMARALDASMSKDRWQELEDEFGFTYAVIGYHALLSSEGPFPYAGHLGKNPLWKLVYLDDFAAVYVKNVPENQKVIQEYAYGFLTPEGLDSQSILQDVEQKQLLSVEKELQRLIQSDPRGIKGLLLLARLYLFSGYHTEAVALANEAKSRSPQDFEPYYILAMVAAKRGDWEMSAQFFDEAIMRGKYENLQIDTEVLNEVYRRAER